VSRLDEFCVSLVLVMLFLGGLKWMVDRGRDRIACAQLAAEPLTTDGKMALIVVCPR
jgi:hypothetical protein